MTTKEVSSAMPASASPPWTTSQSGNGYRRHSRSGGSDLRASDAERAEVADRLSKHYQEGRLDQAEFNERMDRAMNAKTRGEFAGLFADLPDLPEDSGPGGDAGPGRFAGPDGYGGPAFGGPARLPSRRGPRPALTQILLIAGVIVLAIVATHVLVHSVVIWVVGAVLLVLWLRREDRRRSGR
jgi:Flp pilus assembly protein TadB